MYMGVILLLPGNHLCIQSIPHVYGGDPDTFYLSEKDLEYSPCIWG